MSKDILIHEYNCMSEETTTPVEATEEVVTEVAAEEAAPVEEVATEEAAA